MLGMVGPLPHPMSPGAHIRTGSRPPGRVRRMSHSKLRQYLFLSDLQTPRGITSSIGLADSCHAWSVQYGRAHHARLTSHPHLCEVSPRSSLRGPQLTGARLRPSVLGWLSPSFGAISCLGRACAADTHIPAPLSSLTPIDPRTLTITRAFEFCLEKIRIRRTKFSTYDSCTSTKFSITVCFPLQL